MTNKQCERCGEVNPAEIHTCTPKQEEGCAGCGKKASEGWALYCVKCIETVQEPVGWVYEDDEGRMMFSQMPHPDPLWEPVYRAAPKREWQGLTEVEIMSLLPGAVRLPPGWSETARAIEAKLREKNG